MDSSLGVKAWQEKQNLPGLQGEQWKAKVLLIAQAGDKEGSFGVCPKVNSEAQIANVGTQSQLGGIF